MLAFQDEPEAGVRCAPDGALLLAAAELGAWQGIHLPRQRDHREREPDDGPAPELADMLERVWRALQAWQLSLARLDES